MDCNKGGNLHDSRASHDLIDSVRNYSYILADSAYDTSGIYDSMFENTHSIPVIDTNMRRGIILELLTVNRKIGIDLRWEIGRTFSILEEIMGSENIWYTGNRSYDCAIGLNITTYNLMVMSNIETGNKPREIKKIEKL